MKKHASLLLFPVLLLALNTTTWAQNRCDLSIPDIPGYVTLKCDFHIHSVFSDGLVWPTVRVEEAWREGLDAIAITEHIEYTRNDVKGDHNRSWEIANARASSFGLICIQGTEITRSMPPGHFNALFISDANAADTSDFLAAVEAMIKQGAFIEWNHPGWKGQQPDGVSRWYDIHTTLLEKGWLHGIEVVNEREYYPTVQNWCLEKNLTMVGNSDIHQPVNLFFSHEKGEHRPMTLVFAKEKSEAAIKEALLARRTAIWHENLVIGSEAMLAPLAKACYSTAIINDSVKPGGWIYWSVSNRSDFPLHFVSAGDAEGLTPSAAFTVLPRSTVRVAMRSSKDLSVGKTRFELPYMLENFKTNATQTLPVVLSGSIRVTQ